MTIRDSIYKLSDLRKLCKNPTPKGLEKVKNFLEENLGMDLIGEGHGGSIRAAINANNPEVLKALLKYHRENQIDIHERGSEKYNMALYEFKKVFDEILAEYYHVIKEEYLFSAEIKKVLEEGNYLPNEDDEQDSVLELDMDDLDSHSDCDSNVAHQEDIYDSSDNISPGGEIHHYHTEVH